MATGGQEDVPGEMCVSDDSDGWETVKRDHGKNKRLRTNNSNHCSNDKESSFRSIGQNVVTNSNGCIRNADQRRTKYEKKKVSKTSKTTKSQIKIGQETVTTATKHDVAINPAFEDFAIGVDVNSPCESKDDNSHTKISSNRYARLHLLLHKVGLYILRLILLQFIKSSNCEDVVTFLKPFKPSLKGLNENDMLKKLFPKEGKSDINKWDLALLMTVLLHCCTLEKKIDKSKLKQLFHKHVRKTHKDVEYFLRDLKIKAKIDAIRKQISDYEYSNILFPSTCAPTDVDDWSVNLLLRVMITTSANGDDKELNELMRNVIEQEINKGIVNEFNDLKTFLAKKERRLTQKQNKNISDKQFRLIFPENNKIPNIDKWNNDVFLFVVLGIWESLSQLTINGIKKIRNWRNDLSHPTSTSMKKDVFAREWNNMYITFKELVSEEIPLELEQFQTIVNRYGREDLDHEEVSDIFEEKKVEQMKAVKAVDQMIQPLTTTADYRLIDHERPRETIIELRVAARNPQEEQAAEELIKKCLENGDNAISVLSNKFTIMEIRLGCVIVVISYFSLQQLHEFIQFMCSPELNIGLYNLASKIKMEQKAEVMVTACIPWHEVSKLRKQVASYYPEGSATVSTIMSNTIEMLTNPEVKESFGLWSKELSTELGYDVKVYPMLDSHLLVNMLCTGGTGIKKEVWPVGSSLQTIAVDETIEQYFDMSMITTSADKKKKDGDETSNTSNCSPEDMLSNSAVEQTELVKKVILYLDDKTVASTRHLNLRSSSTDEYHHISGNFGFYPMKMLGHGPRATVYKGEYGLFDPRSVAVKVVECSNKQEAEETQAEIVNIYNEFSDLKEAREMKTICTNIIQLLDYCIDNKTSSVYFAFELAIGTLQDYTKPSNVSWQDSLTVENVDRGLVDGVMFTHGHKLVHRDLKPQNIFIVALSKGGLKAVIGNFGSAKAKTGNVVDHAAKTGSFGYIPPEIRNMWEEDIESLCFRFDRRTDIYSLGIMMFYTLSLGKHPFANPVTAQVNYLEQQPKFQHLSCYPNSMAHEVILRRMLDIKPEERPKIEEISGHPALWSTDRIMQFFVNKSGEIETMIEADPLKANLLEDSKLITGRNWMNQLPVNMKTYLKHYKVNSKSQELYSGKETSIRHLLRAIRNTALHHLNYPTSAQAELGTFPDGHIALWLRVCRGLLIHIYDKLGP